MATLETPPPELETPMTPWEPGQPELKTPWAAPAKRPAKPAPVSYTHLTLPTKLL
jgi:hypothetical protein